MRLKILYRKNIKMSPGKLAAQAVHAALGLPRQLIPPSASVVVLSASDKKFNEAKQLPGIKCLVKDAGLTEVDPGTETVVAFFEDDVKSL